MFSFVKIYEKHGDAAFQLALKPLYTMETSLWNVMNTELVDPVNTPINEIVERRKLRATTYLTIKTLKRGNFLLLVGYGSHTWHIANAQNV